MSILEIKERNFLPNNMANKINSYSSVNALISGGQVKSVLLGKLIGANMNIDTDQSITIANASKYIVRGITVTNASISLTTAVGGIYNAASKGGSAIVANSQAYTALSATTKFLDLTLAITDTTQTASTLYLNLTTKQGGAATADVFVFGDILS